MPNFNDLYPSKYLKASDIKGKGEPTVAISYLEVEAVGKNEHKPVLYFQGKEKGMVLNRTNADTIAEFLGEDTDGWMGREITIYVARVQGPNGMTDGLRVKAPQKRQAAPRQNGPRENVITDRGSYKLSETRPRDPIEEVTGAPTRDGDEIPF